MSRYRLQPSAAQEAVLREHCAHARFTWNLAAEQQSWWRPGRQSAPGYLEQCRQLTGARQEFAWLRAGSQMVQQQALRDFAQAMANFVAGTHHKPTWRKAGRGEGFRIVAVKPGQVRRLSRKTGQAWIPKAGWVRFRWSRAVPAAKSYRVTLDRAGRWHIAFAAIPLPVPGPGTGKVVGVDRGVSAIARPENKSRVHLAALQRVRARAPEVAREPSQLPVHRLQLRLQRRCERGQEHRGGARRDCAGRRRDYPASEPRTSTACLLTGK